MCESILSGRFLGGGALIRMNTSRWAARFFNGLWNLVSRVGILMAGSFIFVERRAHRQLGGFSEQLFAGEELEFTQRLKGIAREQGKELVILKSNPLQTSARKVELYSFRELAWFFTRALFAQNRVLQSRDACHPWYDGRR